MCPDYLSGQSWPSLGKEVLPDKISKVQALRNRHILLGGQVDIFKSLREHFPVWTGLGRSSPCSV